jgi:outer membrane protein TolC
MKPVHLAAVGLGLLLAGCQLVGPDYHLPKDAALQRPDVQGEFAGEGTNVISAPVPADWWKLYQDPKLNELVRQALASNTDLRVAAANLSRARAQVEQAQSAGGWSGSAKAGAQRLQESGEAFLLADKVPVANVGDLGISTSYQFDLWGTLQRGIEAAQANADATQAAADTARITLVADVVRAYTQVCAANEEHHIAEQSLQLQAQSTRLTQQLRDAGRGDETQVTRSETQFKSLRAELPRYEALRQSGLFRLSMLLAKPLDQLPSPALPRAPSCRRSPSCCRWVTALRCSSAAPTCVRPSAIWRRPPPSIGVATGALYPDISIGASIGTVGIIDNLGTAAANRWGFGPLLSWTIPSNGSRARIHEAEAATQGALAKFDGVVLNAIRETQTSLVQYTAQLQRRDAWPRPSSRPTLPPTRRTNSSRPGASRSWPTCKRPAPTPICARNCLRPIPRSP